MSEFKITTINKPHLLKKQTYQSATPPPFSLSIQSIVCLNYSIDVLQQIIQAHFQDQQSNVSANLIVKALKVISISLKDEKLRAKVEKVLNEHVNSKKSMYKLFIYWSTCAQNLFLITNKLERTLLVKIVTSLFSIEYFENTLTSRKVFKFLHAFIENSSEEEKELIIRELKDSYILEGNPLNIFIDSLLKNPNCALTMQLFVENLTQTIFQNQRTQQILLDLFRKQLWTTEHNKIDEFFNIFQNLNQIYINVLSNTLQDSKSILNLWIKAQQFKMQVSIKISIRQWINKSNNFWKIVNQCYYSVEQKRFSIFQMAQQLTNDKVLGESLIKKYLYGYFEGLNFELQKQNQFYEECGKKKALLPTNTFESVGEIIKSQSQCSSKGGVNLIMINKNSGPKNWKKSDGLDKQIGKFKIFQSYLEKLQLLFQKLSKKCEKKSQKVELAYHVICFEFLNSDGQKQRFQSSLHDLILLLQGKINVPKHYQSFYISNPNQRNQRSEENKKREYASIVIESFLVKALKKNKTLSKSQLLKKVNFPEQICEGPLKKLLDKGLAQKIGENDEFRYIP